MRLNPDNLGFVDTLPLSSQVTLSKALLSPDSHFLRVYFWSDVVSVQFVELS